MMVHKFSIWAGSKSRSRRKKLIAVWEEHSLPYQGGLITDSVPELLVDTIFQILFIEIGTWKQQAMSCSISCGDRFSFTQRIGVCTHSLVLSSELRGWRDSPLNHCKKYSHNCFSVIFFFSYLYCSLLLVFHWYLSSLYFFFFM